LQEEDKERRLLQEQQEQQELRRREAELLRQQQEAEEKKRQQEEEDRQRRQAEEARKAAEAQQQQQQMAAPVVHPGVTKRRAAQAPPAAVLFEAPTASVRHAMGTQGAASSLTPYTQGPRLTGAQAAAGTANLVAVSGPNRQTAPIKPQGQQQGNLHFVQAGGAGAAAARPPSGLQWVPGNAAGARPRPQGGAQGLLGGGFMAMSRRPGAPAGPALTTISHRPTTRRPPKTSLVPKAKVGSVPCWRAGA
jgi:hypothetical protein